MHHNSPGTVFLIPSIIAEDTSNEVINEQVREVVRVTDYFLAENIRTARRYFSSLKTGRTIESMQFEVLDKKTTHGAMKALFEPVIKGQDVGIVSESGCPGIADPGATAVGYAHQKGLKVVPLVGPSSIFLALMASGFSGQNFAFCGYLPIDKKALSSKIKEIEKTSLTKKQTQIFIETPYRNNQMLNALVTHCHPDTKLCIAKGLTSKEEFIKTATIQTWKSTKIDLHKVPTVFLLNVD